jgi:hypothetical protein
MLMPDSHTVTTRQGYFSRLAGSLVGVLIGLVLLVAAPVLLFWNDGRAVEAERALDAAGRGALSLPAPRADPANDGRLVHATGPLSVATPAPAGDIPVTLPPAVAARRVVEMYQWTQTASSQTREKVGGTQETVTVYTYAADWSATAQDSSAFANPEGHENPPMAFASTRTYGTGVTVGSLAVGEDAVSQLEPASAFVPEAAPAGWVRTASGLYRGAGSEAAPQVGDVKVSWTLVPVGAQASVLGAQSGSGIVAWSPPRSDYQLLKLVEGTVPAAAMVAEQRSAENLLTWVLRGLGTVLCVVSFALLLGPLKALANVLPPVAWLVGSATGTIAIALGLLLALVSIATAWLLFRPLLAGGLILAGIAIWWTLKRRTATQAPAARAAA